MSVLLIDGNNLLSRALWQKRLQDMKVGGRVTGPTHSFLLSLARFVREERPDRMLIAWDGGTSIRRTKLDPRYKAHRKTLGPDETLRRDDSYTLVEQFCDLAGIPQLRLGGLEADDLIAGAWAHLEPEDEDDAITIVSSDKDFGQLLGPNPAGMPTEQLRLGGHDTDTDRWTAQTLLHHRGWTPEHTPLVMALMGDTADGVAGVPGVGPKRAQVLLERNGWDLDRVSAAVLRSHGPEVAEQIAVDYQLVDLRHVELAIEVPRFRPITHAHEDGPALVIWLERYELNTIRNRFLGGSLWVPRDEVVMPGRRNGWPSTG